MSVHFSQQEKKQDEISIKDLIFKIQSWIKYVWGYKWYILIAGLTGGLLGYGYVKYYTKPIYTAKVTFALEQKGSSADLGGLASMVGIGDLGSNSSGMFGGENILFLMKSDRIIHKALKTEIEGLKGGNLLNEYLKIHFQKALKEKKIELFERNLDTIVFSRDQDSILQLVTSNIREDQLIADRLDKKTSIINVAIKDENELWAFMFSKMLIKHAITLYMDIKMGKLIETESTLMHKRDSIRRLLDGSITNLAVSTDLDSHTPLMRHKTNQAKKQIDVQMLTALYGDIVKNLEITRFNKSQEEPIIEIIDEPIMPLDYYQLGKVKGVILGSILVAFSVLVFLISRNVLKQLLN